jgi:hypothetical protein
LELDEARLQNLQVLDAQPERLEAPTQCRPETKLAEGEPALAVLSVARQKKSQPTLLAVGSRGLGAPKRMILGSVSTRVLREAEEPVLIAPCGSRSITATRPPTSAEPRRGGSETEAAKRVSPHRRDELSTRPREPDLEHRSKAGVEEARRVLPGETCFV